MTADPSSTELSPIKRALLEIRELRARLAEMEQAQAEPIAITGVGLRFPGGANDLETFWRLLHDGVDAIREIPASRWSLDAYYDADVSIPGKMTTRYGSFLDDIDQFDAAFFGISPREAISMDPQQRLLLETAWEALENAGQSPDALLGSQTGVFVGIANSDYFRMVVSDPAKIDTYASTGGTLSVAAGRIAYLLGLRGPAMSVDTACSSSLVSIHLACQSLRQRECDLALAGGVNVILTPEANINFSKAGMMAVDGRCKTFDAAADGYVRGEGCAMITLKRLSDAQAAGDPILAVILSSAINQDGRSSGLTAPSGPAQEAVIRAALENAGVAPHQVGYVEAHGTGTSLGDPIEMRALGQVYGQGRASEQPLVVGSVKTNLGHLEAAAGIAGLLKVALALQHGEIPASLHFRTPNPHIAWDELPVRVPVEHTPWPAIQGRRIGAVSSFGFSGTNAHVILGEAPARPVVSPEPPPDAGLLRLVTLSARSEGSLRGLAERYSALLAGREFSRADFAALARASSVEHAHYPQRLALAAADADQLRAALAGYQAGKDSSTWWRGQHLPGETPAAVFLFTGHGSHYANMGRDLYESEPVFRAAMDACDAFLRGRLPKPLLAVLYPTAGESSADLDDMTYGQPAMFALQYALASLWRAWGVEPAAVSGHSLGEYAAAVIAGVMRLEDGLTLIAERGRLMQQLPEDGRMATIFASEDVVADLVRPHAARVSIAALNSPEAVVISGYGDAVQAVLEAAAGRGLRSKALNIYRAAHSPVVEAMLPGIARTTQGMYFQEAQIEFISSVTGGLVREEIAQAGYWQRHLRQPVRFAAAAQALYDAGYRVFIEIGPHPTLLSLAQRTLPEAADLLWLPSLRENQPARAQILESLAMLYVNGAEIDWKSAQPPAPRPAFRLPTTPWDRKPYWWESTPAQQNAPAASAWESAIAAAEHQAQQAPLDLEIRAFPAQWSALDRLAAAYIAHALHSLGAFLQPGERHSPQTLLERFGIKPAYQALMARWLRQMAGCGWLRAEADSAYVAEHPLAAPDLAALREEAERALANAPFVSEYVNACGERLADVITGKESPLELMFPGGSLQRAEDLYQNWAHARYFHDIVAETVAAIAQGRAGKTLRLLEIGAGTGSSTAGVLRVLPAGRSEYHFTDVSDLFLERARQKFAAYPFVRYGLFDVEKDGLAQGYGRGQFDVILAGNVIHATRSLQDTLQNVRALLAPGGVLVLFEATTHLNWFDITTGLIEGWQSFGDELRADSPLLSAAQWRQVLAEAGFEEVVAVPQPGSPAEVLGESVILARPQVTVETVEATAPAQAAAERSAQAETAPEADFVQTLAAALPDERQELLLDFVRRHVVAVLRLDPDAPPDRKARLMDLGVDSLMAVELRGRLSLGLGLTKKLPATLIFDYPSIQAISDYLLRDVLVFEQPAAPSAAPSIADLSDEQVEAMLMAKLKKLQ